MDEPSPQMRASDADRERVAGQLRTSLGEGRLTLQEFDERVASVYAARTYGELSAVTADLPVATPSPVDFGKASVVQRAPGPPARPSSPLRSAWGAFLSINLTLFVIWLLTAVLGHGDASPWFLWVTVPSGAALLGREIQHRFR